MAEEEPEEEGLEPPPPSTNPFRYIVLIVFIMIIEAVGGYLFLDYAIPAREMAPDESESEQTVVAIYEKPTFFEGLADMVVNLAGTSRTLVLLTLVLELGPVNQDATHAELVLKQDLIWDLVLKELEGLSVNEIRDPLKLKVKDTVARVVNEELRNGSVEEVYVTKIVLQ